MPRRGLGESVQRRWVHAKSIPPPSLKNKQQALKAVDGRGAATWKRMWKPDAARNLGAAAQEGQEGVERQEET